MSQRPKRRSTWLPKHLFIKVKEQEREARAQGRTVSDGQGPSFPGVCLQCGYVHGITDGCYKERRRWRSRKGGPLPKEPECALCGFFHSWESECPKLVKLKTGEWVMVDKTTQEYRKEIAYVRKWITSRAS